MNPSFGETLFYKSRSVGSEVTSSDSLIATVRSVVVKNYTSKSYTVQYFFSNLNKSTHLDSKKKGKYAYSIF